MFPLLLLVARLFQGRYIPHPIPDNILTEFILLGLGGDFQISVYRNSIKLGRSYINFACILCTNILFKGMQVEFNMINRTSPVF